MATNPRDRELVESPLYQGVDEIVAYGIDMAAIGTPSTPSCIVKDVTNGGADVTATVMPVNSPTIAGSIITLSPLRALTAGILYRVEVKCVISGNTLEHYFYVHGQE